MDIDIEDEVGCSLSSNDNLMINCTGTGNFEQEVQLLFMAVTITFSMYVHGHDHKVVYIFERPIMGKYDGIYRKNSRLAIMERSVYVYAPPD